MSPGPVSLLKSITTRHDFSSGDTTLKNSILVASALCLFLGSVTAEAQQVGDLKIRFEYGGDAPAPKPANVNKDVAFCGKTKLMDETLVVNAENKGIANVVVYVYVSRRGGSKIDPVPPRNETVTLANDKCRFEPHIVLAQTGDTLRVTNPDDVGHNANLQFFNNQQQNFLIPAKQEKSVKLEQSEPAPIPVDCNIHPWMKARVLVLDHPYAGVSDANGDMLIKGLPAGELVFRVNHEAGSIKEVTVAGKKTIWDKSRFEVDIKPELNDLGTVVIPAESFQ